MKSRAQLGTGTHDALRPACPTSSGAKHSRSIRIVSSKDLPNMKTFCDWLFETIVISVYDSFFRNYISIVLLSFIVFYCL